MNTLFKLKRSNPVTSLVSLKYLIYFAMLSDVKTLEEDSTVYGVCSKELSDIREFFMDWESVKGVDVFQKSIEELASDGLIMFGDDGETVYLGEYRGKRLFPFEVKSSLSDEAVEILKKKLSQHKKSKSAVTSSRGRFLAGQVESMLDAGIDKLTAADFTELHSVLYELYTGGEVYQIRNKTEYFQTNNILKAYDKFTTFAILVEGVLNYHSYRTRGVPTLINVAVIKDDIFRKLTNPIADGSKEYMREADETSDF